MSRLELWAGAECTVNRVGEHFRDQLRENGHHDRLEDIDLLPGLGISALRFPLLWERVAPLRGGEPDWAWSDARLARLRELGIRPIAGLVHHGSGPLHTNLLDDGFAPGLAAFARAAAERYPWIDAWTPVNEPVTTARFSALYGHWYPHARDERSFWRALLNQIDGVRRAMAEIRKVNPAARLIQTDDLGRTFATAAVREQAAFDNVRRWMGWDLLCGRVIPGHPFWQRLCDFGLEGQLRAIAAAPCPPDVIGVNHYLTSDRFLDHRIRRYPDHLRGGNGQRRFADTEAVRVLDPPPPGLRGVLREAWERYGIPLAVTEAHNGCTREEQMRWLADAWATAEALKAEGVDILAVTAWSLFGSHGWDRLLTAQGRYEPGIYDVSDGTPRPTAMVGLLRALARSGGTHPACRCAGWWRRPIRLLHPVVPRPAPMRDRAATPDWRQAGARPLLIVGADDERGRGVAAACTQRGLTFRMVDATDSFAEAADEYQPWAVLTLSGAGEAAAVRSICRGRGIISAEFEPQAQVDRVLDRLIDAFVATDEPGLAA
jgi:dTDP-4-dehydrorhamnose reductase